MSLELINELRNEHARILELLSSCTTLAPGSAAWRQSMKDAEGLFVAHLQKEDQQLYPAMRSAGAAEPGLPALVENFSREIDQVSRKVRGLFKEFGTASSTMGFRQELAPVLEALTVRFRKEETVLYARLERGLRAR